MKKTFFFAAIAAGLCVSMSGYAAQAPTSAPAGSTALCKDGSFSSSAAKKGACTGHKGLKKWYGGAAASSTAPAMKMAPGAAMSAPSSPTAMKSATAPGGGPGQVWVNTKSKVYHCPTDKYYGKTKSGSYMSESDAKAKGYHPDHGKTCS